MFEQPDMPDAQFQEEMDALLPGVADYQASPQGSLGAQSGRVAPPQLRAPTEEEEEGGQQGDQPIDQEVCYYGHVLCSASSAQLHRVLLKGAVRTPRADQVESPRVPGPEFQILRASRPHKVCHDANGVGVL